MEMMEEEKKVFVIPELSVKDLLHSIPSHCFKRSAARSLSFVVWDLLVVFSLYFGARFLESQLSAQASFLRFAVWSLYGFGAGLFCTGLWVLAHECGHGAFSESRTLNTIVGWILHSALGIPYHAWRISHAKHHASTGHMTEDQVFIPRTLTELGVKDPRGLQNAFNAELVEALGDSPIVVFFGCVRYLLIGFPAYLLMNAAGQRKYPLGTNHFSPNSMIFSKSQQAHILVSDLGIVLWISALYLLARAYGIGEVMKVYGVPYLWMNHWLILITFLQHTDPLVPHYQAEAHTFPRGALATLDRSLLGDVSLSFLAGPAQALGLDKIASALGVQKVVEKLDLKLQSTMAALGAHATHGLSETHVLHHVCSKVPHYHAWEAAAALRKRLSEAGINLQGAPGGWREMFRVYRECRFVEETDGPVMFYKNAYGQGAARAVFASQVGEGSDSDSGVEMVDK